MPPQAWYGGRPMPTRLELGGQLLTGGPDALGRYWHVLSVRGWRGTAKPRNRSEALVGASGQSWGSTYRDGRVITLADCGVACPTADIRCATEDLLAGLFPDRDDADLLPLVRTGEDGVAQVRYVWLDDALELVPNGPRWLDYEIQLIAPDPRKFAAAWATSEAGPPVDGVGGIDMSGTGIDFSGAGVEMGTAGTPSIASVQGGGTAGNPVVYEVTGEASDVIIADTTGSSRLRYRGQVPAGYSVFLNCDPQPAYGVPGAAGPIPGYGALLGTSDASSAVTVTGGWPVVPPGEGRRFAVIGGQMSSNALLRVHSRSAWD